MSEVRDYWDAYLENNPLRVGEKETDAAAFLSVMIENAGDMLREYYAGRSIDFTDWNYITEKWNRIKNNLKYPRDWSDPLSIGEKERLKDTKSLLQGLPTPDATANALKELLRSIMDRNVPSIIAYLDILKSILKKEKVIPTGMCYPDSWRFLMQQGEGYLVHGSVQLSAEGARINHAWVELSTGFVWEPQLKQFFTKDDFKVLSPIENNRYTAEQAAVMVARTGKHGPWSDEERKQFIGG